MKIVRGFFKKEIEISIDELRTLTDEDVRFSYVAEMVLKILKEITKSDN